MIPLSFLSFRKTGSDTESESQRMMNNDTVLGSNLQMSFLYLIIQQGSSIPFTDEGILI